MRRTLTALAALPLAALAFVYCNNDTTTGTNPDLSTAGEDLTTGNTNDLSDPPADLTSSPDMTVPAVATEFAVLRIGAGTAALTNDATPGFLERRRIADGSLVGNALALPTAANGASKQLTFSGLATVEGNLSRSGNGKYLLVAGYAANPGVANISTSNAMTNNRVIATIDAANTVNTTTAFNGFSGTAVRGATSTDGTMLWASSDNGVAYTTLGSTAAPTVLNISNFRALGLFSQNNAAQLFASGASAPTHGLNAIGTGTPMVAGTTSTTLTGFNPTNSPSSYGFFGFDRDGNGSVDQFYVADDRTAGGGGLQRWKLNGTSWTLEGTITTGNMSGARGVTGFVSNTTVTLLVTTAEVNNVAPRVVKMTDNGGATSTVTSQLLVTAMANTTYRGIALAPIP